MIGWLFELSQVGAGALPGLRGMLQDPCWIPAVRFPGRAYYFKSASAIVGASVTYGVGCGKVHVIGPRRTVKGVEWMHSLHFSSVCVHSAGSLAGLDVTPDHRSHVSLVVHKAGIEVGRFVRVR
jgi:hypothetical protein